MQKLINILLLGLVVLLSGRFNPVKATAINLSSDEELNTYETALDGRLSVSELSGLSPPENRTILFVGTSEKTGAWEKSVLKIHRADDAVVLDTELVDSWSILKNRPKLKTDIPSLEALNRIRKNTKLGDLKITDDMLSKIEGIPNVSYAQILDDLDVAIKALPEGKVVDFQKVISDGQRGLVNKNNVWDRRHSWLTLKKIKENETFLKNADEIKFEVELEQIDGISNAVPDIVVTKSGTGGTTKKIIGEVKAGDNVITTNFNSQSLRYFQEIADVRDLRLFRRDGVPLTKQQVIDSWKNGVTNNQRVRELFTDYYNRINDADLDITFTQAQLESFLSTNDNWFDLIFNSSF